MSNIEIYCVTDKELPFLEKSNYKLAAVGKGKFSNKYIKCNNQDNIFYKEKNYSELTFHYWFWKNQLNLKDNNTWFGFCQKRRFWLNSKSVSENDDILNVILQSIPKEWNNYEAVICEPIYLGTKLSKLIKRGWKNILNKPSLLFNHSEINIKLQFDMHHGYNVLDRAIDVMDEKDREDFRNFVNTKNLYNPHIMFISKKKILDKFFKDQFDWLSKCEKVFGFDNLKDYDQTRLYAFLAERFVSFWFKKYSKSIEWPWIFFENKAKK
tara:strand:+ start:43 stop:843 length:801 start_codon:yes stop_codon:yes gene_type:complete